MALDLGALIGHVVLDTSQFDRGYVSVVRRMGQLGVEADKAAAGTRNLDRGLIGAGASADKAAAASDRHAAALKRVDTLMGSTAGETARVQQATLRLAAAQDRLNAVQESGVATTRQLASAQAGLIGAQRGLAAAQAKTTGGMRAWLGSSMKMAGELGLIVGAIELVKKGIDIGKEASAFQRDMLMIQTQAGASAAEVKAMTAAVLGMAGDVATKPEELATSLYHVESVGLRGAKALDVVRIAAEGAKVGNADLEQTTNALTSTVASGIKGVNNMSQAMGALNTIVGSGDMRLSDLNDALGGGILTVAKGFGVTLTDVGAALATFGDNNIRGADAATALRMSIMALSMPVKGGAAALASIGVRAGQLRDDLEKGGLNLALNNLSAKMTKAGVTGSKVGGFITQAFGRKAGAGIGVLLGQMDRFNAKFAEVARGAGGFADRWKATQQTASFAFQKIGAEASSMGITLYQRVLPGVTSVAAAIGRDLPKAVHAAGSILGPFVSMIGGIWAAEFHVLGGAISFVGAALGPVVHLLEAIKTPLGAVGVAALGAWVAFRAASAIPGIIAAVSSAMETAALKAMYFGDAVKASAVTAVGSMTTIGASADATAAEVAAAGEAGSVGWAGLLGPLAAVGVGVALLVTMFHRSTSASAEATSAAKAYSEALQSGGKTTIVDAIVKQLTDNNLPQKLRDLNTALGTTQYTGTQFASAIESGGKPLAALRQRLEDVVKSGTRMTTVNYGYSTGLKQTLTPAAEAAKAALADLNAQYSGLTKSAQKDLLNTKAFAGVSSSIDKVSQSTQVGSDTARKYASMMGIVVDKDGIAAVSAKTLDAAIGTVSTAFDTATQTGSGFLDALQSFSQSAGTASDRAALIGATLKAANGDALNFAGQMNNAAVAERQLSKDISSASGADKAAAKAKKDNTDATAAAFHANQKYMASIVNLRTGTIRYNHAAAAPLINSLAQIQSTALAAAQAQFQHSRATMGGKAAADSAYKTYVHLTRDALIPQLRQLGLNKDQAQKLADKYLGMPKDVKTKIEQEGSDPIVKVLDQIGRQLSFLTGHPWRSKVGVDTGDSLSQIGAVRAALGSLPGSVGVSISTSTAGTGRSRAIASGSGATFGRHDGTIPPNTTFTVGEAGWEGGHTDSQGRATIYSNSQSKALGFTAPVGYANGSNDSIAGLLAGLGLSRNGIAAVLGNWKVESNLNPHAYNAREGAHGLGQWEGSRWPELQAYARAHHLAVSSIRAQVGFFAKEMRSYPRLMAQLRSGKHSAATLAGMVDQQYERSSGSTRTARQNYATAYAKHLPTGTGGSGGSWDAGSIPGIGTTTVGGKKRWTFNGTTYASQEAATNARNRWISSHNKAAGSAAAALPGDLGGIGRTVRNMINPASSTTVLAGVKRVENDLRKFGLPQGFINHLTRENAAIGKAVDQRNKVAKHFQAANAALADARKRLADDKSTFKSAALGGFDITTAGQNDDGKVTGGSVLASSHQAVTRLRTFTSTIKRLAHDKVFPGTYLRSLMAGYPGSYAEVVALGHMSRGQIASLAKDQRAMNALAGSASGAVATRLDQPSVDAAKKTEMQWAKRYVKVQRALDKRLAKMTNEIADELHHLHFSLGLTRGQLALLVTQGVKDNKTRRRTSK